MKNLRSQFAWALLSGLACESAGTEIEADRSIVINEVASTDGDRIELLNRSSEVVHLYGWSVMDSDRDPTRSYVFPDGTYIAPGQIVVLYKGDHHTFGLGDADSVVLADPLGAVSDETSWKTNAALTSWCRVPDITGPFKTCVRPTFGSLNPVPGDDGAGAAITPTLTINRSADVPLDTPDELGFDDKGRLWLGIPSLLQIAIVDATGSKVGTVGGQGTGPGQFFDDGGASGPHAIRIRGDRAYATDRSGARVNIYDANTLEPVGTLQDASFADPKGLAIEAGGAVWVSDSTTGTVTRFRADGTAELHITELDETVTDRNGVACQIPCGAETLALDEERRRLFVTSSEAGRIEVIDLDVGEYTGQYIAGRQAEDKAEPGRVFDEVEGIAVDAENDLLFAVDENNGRILVFDLAAPTLFDPAAAFGFIGSFGRGGEAPGEFRAADGLDLRGGLLAVADQENDRIQVFSIATITASLGR